MSDLGDMLHEYGLDREPLSSHIVNAVRRAAVHAVACQEPLEPETIDLDNLLDELAAIAAERLNPSGGILAASLIRLAALALLWADSADELADVLDAAGLDRSAHDGGSSDRS